MDWSFYMIVYDSGKEEYQNWMVVESEFSPYHLGKFESIFSLGNGYMGLRSATEEFYYGETRDWLVNGTFNKADPTEVTELPNLADVTQVDLYIDGERFSLEKGKVFGYQRELNLKDAELIRSFQWESPHGKRFEFKFRRFVSLAHRHVVGMRIEVKSLTHEADLRIVSCINGQTTNTGAQHFLNGVPRIYDQDLLEYVQTTNDSNVDVVIHSRHELLKNGQLGDVTRSMLMARRKVGVEFSLHLMPNDNLTLEKMNTVYTSRDQDVPNSEELKRFGLKQVRNLSNYDLLFEKHRQAWLDQVWNRYQVEIDSENPFDQLAMRFSIYHMTVMTPAHDERMGIGAKGLSGEGYKGHSFWDTEIFILPFFTYSNPKVARSLLTYRYLGLESARQKAKENGYEGAMYPWEMAFPDDGEATPLYGDIDIVTGERSKIWSGMIEQHITADISFAIYQYVQVTGDQAFLDEYGYEIVLDSARFWASRLEWQADRGRYEIHDVIGPDEYKEHVNNNAYTNYMAYFNLKLAIRYVDELKKSNQELYEKLNQLLNIEDAYPNWLEKVEKIYLPQPNEVGIIPQDDTYFNLTQIDLSKYKQQTQARTIYKDYNQEQINGIQVTKQADVLILLYLLEQTFLKDDVHFNQQLKKNNFDFYEPRTLHDSSLSLSTHAILASELGDLDLAYDLFKHASDIDLGPNMTSSNDGIHAASIAGIWSIAIFGFAGVRLTDSGLTVQPNLPKEWRKLSFNIEWHSETLHIVVTHDEVSISKSSDHLLKLSINQVEYKLANDLTVPLVKTSVINNKL